MLNRSEIATLLQRARRFAATGVLATGVHVATAATLIETGLASPGPANGIAFICATTVSYTLNTLWSFSSRIHRRTAIRFLVVACLGTSLSTGTATLADHLGFHYLIGIAMVLAVVPAMNFTLHNLWTYR